MPLWRAGPQRMTIRALRAEQGTQIWLPGRGSNGPDGPLGGRPLACWICPQETAR